MEREDKPPRGAPAPRPALSVMDAIARRVSCRAYRPDPVPDEHLARILDAARLAPSACNRQPWRFAVVRDPIARRRLVDEAFLPGIRMPWAADAPVLVAIGMELSFLTHRVGGAVSGVDYPWIDIGIAGEHLVLAATELGLGTCWIGWIRPRSVAQIVGWTPSVKPAAIISVGYSREAAARGPGERKRKDRGEIVTWV